MIIKDDKITGATVVVVVEGGGTRTFNVSEDHLIPLSETLLDDDKFIFTGRTASL